jgi:hypothetical protein
LSVKNASDKLSEKIFNIEFLAKFKEYATEVVLINITNCKQSEHQLNGRVTTGG